MLLEQLLCAWHCSKNVDSLVFLRPSETEFCLSKVMILRHNVQVIYSGELSSKWGTGINSQAVRFQNFSS